MVNIQQVRISALLRRRKAGREGEKKGGSMHTMHIQGLANLSKRFSFSQRQGPSSSLVTSECVGLEKVSFTHWCRDAFCLHNWLLCTQGGSRAQLFVQRWVGSGNSRNLSMNVHMQLATHGHAHTCSHPCACKHIRVHTSRKEFLLTEDKVSGEECLG